MRRRNRKIGSVWIFLLVPVVLLALGVLTAVYFIAKNHARMTSVSSVTQSYWIIESQAIAHLQDAGASKTLLDRSFNTDKTFLTGHVSTGINLSNALKTATYTSYQSIKNAFADGILPGNYRAVIYDNENWPLTPVAEQRNPSHYEQLVSSLLHAHGLLYIATPATDLVKATGRAIPKID